MQINIKHILIGWYNKIFLKEQDLANYRLDICKHCQHNVKFLGQDVVIYVVNYGKEGYVKGCGCNLSKKVRLSNAKCIIRKW